MNLTQQVKKRARKKGQQPFTIKELQFATESYTAIRSAVRRLTEQGILERISLGQYRITPNRPANKPSPSAVQIVENWQGGALALIMIGKRQWLAQEVAIVPIKEDKNG